MGDRWSVIGREESITTFSSGVRLDSGLRARRHRHHSRISAAKRRQTVAPGVSLGEQAVGVAQPRRGDRSSQRGSSFCRPSGAGVLRFDWSPGSRLGLRSVAPLGLKTSTQEGHDRFHPELGCTPVFLADHPPPTTHHLFPLPCPSSEIGTSLKTSLERILCLRSPLWRWFLACCSPNCPATTPSSP